MANGILMSGQPLGALDANYISQARQSPIGEPEDPYRAMADALRFQEAQATSEIDRIKGSKLGQFVNALGAFGAGIQGRDPSQFTLQGRLAPWQEQQRQAQLGIAQTGLQRQQAEQQALQRMGGLGTYNPRDYTTDSWAQFVETRDPSVLVRHDPFTQGGVRYVPDGQGGVVPVVSEQQQMGAGQIQAEIDRLRAMQKEIGTRSGEVETAPEVGEARAEIAREVETGKQSVKRAGELFDQVQQVRSSLPNYDEAIAAIDAGASTGRVQGLLPSFRESTLRFESAANKLGLDVVGSVTFGALSEGELKLAMETAVPRGMEGDALKRWLQRKRDAQTKLANELEDAAIFFQRGGTQAEWAERGRRLRGDSAPAEDKKAPAQPKFLGFE